MNKSIRITAIIIRVTGVVGLDGFLIGFAFYTNSVSCLLYTSDAADE